MNYSLKLFFILLTSLSNFAFSQVPVIEITDKDTTFIISQSSEYFEDISTNVTIEDILDTARSFNFVKDESFAYNFGHTKSAYWIRFKIINKSSGDEPWVLLQKFSNMHSVDFYQVENDAVVKRILTGVNRPTASRENPDNRFAFKVIKPMENEATIYMCFKNDASMTINMELMNERTYLESASFYNYIFGAFIGILFILIISNFIIYLALNDPSYLYFTIAILSLMFFYFSYTGFAYLYLWPDYPAWNMYSVAVFNNLLTASLLLLTQSFLELKRHLQLINNLIKGLLVLTALNFILMPFLDIQIIIQFSVYTTLLLFLSMLISGISSYKNQKQAALYFLFSFTGIIFHGIILVLVRMGLLSPSISPSYGFMVSVVFMFLMLTYALITRVTSVKKEREYANRMIQVSEDRFRAIVESSNDFIWETDHDGKYTYASPTVKDMLGYDPLEILGKTPFELMPEKEAIAVKEKFGKYILEKKPFENLENINLTKDGKEVVLETSGVPFFDSKNNLVGYRGVDRNITERKKYEETLQLSEKNFRALLNATSAMVFLMDTDFKVIALNSALADKYKERPENIIGKSIFDFSSDEISRNRKSKVESVIKTKKTIRWEDDSPFGIYSNTVYPIFDSDGNVKRLAVYINEITDRKKAEEQIRILSASVEQSPFSIIMLSAKGVITYVNKKCVEVTGYHTAELLNKRLAKIQPGVPFKQMLDDILNGKDVKGEYKVSKKDGSPYWESMNLFPIKDTENKISHIICINEDISKQRELENQLQQSQKMEAIGTLAGGIAHDFNNLLTIINGYSDLALTKVEDGSLKKALTNIRAASQKAEDLTRQILAFSKKQIYRPKIIDVNAILTNFNRMIPRLIGEDIKINIRLANDLNRIKADPSQFEQVILNLIVNARDAIKERTGSGIKKQINISTENIWLDEEYTKSHIGSNGGAHACLSVSDTGIGMDRDIQEKIFEPFFTTKGPGKGTGLGLSTVFGIVKQNGGSVYVYSEVNKGTTIKIYWPITDEELTFKENIQVKNEELSGNEKILFVEDNAEILSFANNTLSEFGYRVFSVDGGQKALDLIVKNKQKFDILISDMVMPDINGKELAEKILELIPGIKILFTSGYTDDHIVTSGELSKEVNFLQKPFTVSSLLTKIREVLNEKS